MISEEDKIRYSECKNCTTCQEWHHHCNAECCKSIKINMDPKEISGDGKYLTIIPRNKLKISDIFYYQYHDVEYIRGQLRFKRDRIYIIGNNVWYLHPCCHLENNLCKLHGTSQQPIMCQELTLESAKIEGNPFVVTDNCLFKYKSKERKGGENNG